jgi:hypothetical protein
MTRRRSEMVLEVNTTPAVFKFRKFYGKDRDFLDETHVQDSEDSSEFGIARSMASLFERSSLHRGGLQGINNGTMLVETDSLLSPWWRTFMVAFPEARTLLCTGDSKLAVDLLDKYESINAEVLLQEDWGTAVRGEQNVKSLFRIHDGPITPDSMDSLHGIAWALPHLSPLYIEYKVPADSPIVDPEMISVFEAAEAKLMEAFASAGSLKTCSMGDVQSAVASTVAGLREDDTVSILSMFGASIDLSVRAKGGVVQMLIPRNIFSYSDRGGTKRIMCSFTKHREVYSKANSLAMKRRRSKLITSLIDRELSVGLDVSVSVPGSDKSMDQKRLTYITSFETMAKFFYRPEERPSEAFILNARSTDNDLRAVLGNPPILMKGVHESIGFQQVADGSVRDEVRGEAPKEGDRDR